jgi:hypothetical protein
MRTRRTRNAVAVVLAGMLIAAVSPALAQAQPALNTERTVVPTSSIQSLAAEPTPVALKNFKSKKLLQPAGDSGAVGAKIVQWSFTGRGTQAWWLVADGSYDSFWNYTTRLNMGIDRASTSAGAPAIQATPSGDLNQDWTIDWRSDTVFRLKNRKSGKCLGISNASTANGAQAAQFDCDDKANQGWEAIPVTAGTVGDLPTLTAGSPAKMPTTGAYR